MYLKTGHFDLKKQQVLNYKLVDIKKIYQLY
jgi:hypothetical protein